MNLKKSLPALLLGLGLGGAAWGAPGFVRSGGLPSGIDVGRKIPFPVAGTLKDRVDFKDLGFRALAGNRLRLQSQSAQPLLVRGMPQLLVSVRRYQLPPGKTATARLENLQVEQSNTRVSVPLTPEPMVWNSSVRLPPLSLRAGKFFPGKWVESQVSDGILVVKVFPAQVELATGKLFVVRDADVRIDYSDDTWEIHVPDIWASPGIILTSHSLKGAATKLQRFHSQVLKLKSDIVLVEEIAKSEEPVSEEDLPEGYKSDKPWDNLVDGYDYLTARKIVSYLQKRMGSGNPTKYVTILGDARQVPPSYYFFTEGIDETQVGVTDQCYAARKKCQEPRLAVGRLPFENEGELDNYLRKAARWLQQSQGAKSELALFAGKAFPADVFTAELSSLMVINSAKDDWRGVRKYFRTNQKFDKERVLGLVNGKVDSSFIYYLDHGSGNLWSIDDDGVSANEILQAEGGESNPFVVSISCSNAAFDEELTTEHILSHPQGGNVSVGVALLRSRSGAVAYLGAPRPALGTPIYDVDTKGNLSLTGTNYGLNMFETFYAKYRDRRGGRVGDGLLDMYRGFLHENGNELDDEANLWTYFNTQLLGDPAMPLPDRGVGEKVVKVPASTVEMEELAGNAFPLLKWTQGTPLSLSFSSVGNVSATLVKLPKFTFSDQKEVVVVEKEVEMGKPFTTELPAGEEPGLYFLRLENRDGVPFERQVWFNVKTVSPHL